MNLASPELCARWIALGAWYPYARVHHAQSFQELYRRASPSLDPAGACLVCLPCVQGTPPVVTCSSGAMEAWCWGDSHTNW